MMSRADIDLSADHPEVIDVLRDSNVPERGNYRLTPIAVGLTSEIFDITDPMPPRQEFRSSIISLLHSDTTDTVIDLSSGPSPRRRTHRHHHIREIGQIDPDNPLIYMLMSETPLFRRPRSNYTARRAALFTHPAMPRPTIFKPSEVLNLPSFLSSLPVQRIKTQEEANGLGSCPICLQEYKPRMAVRVMSSSCGHKVHKSCFDTWIHKRGVYKCPLDNLPLPFQQ